LHFFLVYAISYRACLAPRAQQLVLLAAQHLDALQVEGLRQRVIRVEADGAHLDRRVVDVDARGARAARGGDTTDRDRVGSRVIDGHPRGEARDVLEVLDAQLVHRLLGQGGDADRHLAQGLLVACRRHHHFLQPGHGLLVGVRARPGHGR
jgi:hypothetical protein